MAHQSAGRANESNRSRMCSRVNRCGVRGCGVRVTRGGSSRPFSGTVVPRDARKRVLTPGAKRSASRGVSLGSSIISDQGGDEPRVDVENHTYDESEAVPYDDSYVPKASSSAIIRSRARE